MCIGLFASPTYYCLSFSGVITLCRELQLHPGKLALKYQRVNGGMFPVPSVLLGSNIAEWVKQHRHLYEETYFRDEKFV